MHSKIYNLNNTKIPFQLDGTSLLFWQFSQKYPMTAPAFEPTIFRLAPFCQAINFLTGICIYSIPCHYKNDFFSLWQHNPHACTSNWVGDQLLALRNLDQLLQIVKFSRQKVFNFLSSHFRFNNAAEKWLARMDRWMKILHLKRFHQQRNYCK